MFRNVLSRIKWGAVFCGVLLIIFGIYSAVMAHKSPFDFNKLYEDDIKSGMMVEGEIYGNYGSYEESYNTRYGIKDKSSTVWYFMIPVGDEGFMGVAVNAKAHGDEYMEQTDQTLDYIFDETDTVPLPDPIHVKGRINKMDSKDRELFSKALADMGYTSSEIEHVMVPFYISNGSYEGWLVEIIVGLILSAVGVILIFVTRKRQ